MSICLIIVAMALLACGSDSDGGISIWEQMDPAEQELLDRHLARWMELHPGTLVERVHLEPGQLIERFPKAARSGSAPELVFASVDEMARFANSGLLEALDAHFSTAHRDSFYAETLPLLAPRGKGAARIWFLPDQVGEPLTLCFNRAMVPNPPSSFKHLIGMAGHWTRDEDGDGRPETHGLVFDQTEPEYLVPFLGGFGGWMVDENKEPTLGSRAMASALSYLQHIKFDQGILPSAGDADSADSLFILEKAAFIISGPRSWQQYTDAGIDLGMTPIPQVFGGGWPRPILRSKGYGLNADVPGKKREQALALMDYLTSESVQMEKAAALGTFPSRLSAAKKADDLLPFAASVAPRSNTDAQCR